MDKISFLLTLLFLTGSLGLGLQVLKFLKFNSSNLLYPAALLLGLSIVSYAVLVLGQLNLLTPTALWTIFILIALCSIFLFRHPSGSWGPDKEKKSLDSSFGSTALTTGRWNDGNILIPEAIVLGICALLAFLYGLKPEIFFDSWVYHLGLPRIFLEEASTRPIPHHFFSAMPLLKEMLSTLGLQIGGESMAKWIVLAMSLVAPWSLYEWAKEKGQPRAGWAAAALFITTPIVFTALRRGVTEPVMASYLILALYFCLRGEAFLCGLFAGFLYACKYFSLPWCALLFIFFAFQQFRHPRIIRGQTPMLLGFLIAALPWMLRNLFAFGDPFYPVLSGFLGKLPSMEGWMIFREESPHWAGAVPVLGALQALWRGSVSSAEWAYFLGPSYLILSGLSLILFRHSRPSTTFRINSDGNPGPIWIFLFSAGAISLSQTHHLRYLSPLLAPLSLLLCLQISRAWSAAAQTKGEGKRRVLVPFITRGIFLLMLAFHVFWMTRPLADPVEAMGLTGQVSRQEYLSARFGYFWQGVEWINQNTPPHSRILVWGETRSYGFKRPLVISTVHDRHPLLDWMLESKNAAELKARLDKEGIGFIFWHPLEAQRLEGYGAFHFNAEQAILWNRLRESLRPVFQNEGVIIYQNTPR